VNALVLSTEQQSLPALVRRAASALSSATSAAEVLDARDMARAGYDAAKSAARIAKAKKAHDDVIGAVYRAQADALEIEATAKRRLADEYDAAQDRGEVGRQGSRSDLVSGGNEVVPSAADLGLTRKDIHEARQIRDAEDADPGIVRRTLDERLAAGHEPTKAALREAVTEAAIHALRGSASARPRNPHYRPNPARDAALEVADCCGRIVGHLGFDAPETVLAAFLDDAERERGLAKIRGATVALTKLMQVVDAE